MARISLDNPHYFLNRDTSWLSFNRRVFERPRTKAILCRSTKFLSISASNMDEFFEVRVAAMMQQIEDGYNEAGPDGLTLTEKRDVLNKLSPNSWMTNTTAGTLACVRRFRERHSRAGIA